MRQKDVPRDPWRIRQAVLQAKLDPADGERFEAVYRECFSRIYRSFSRPGLDPETRDDLIQETFARVYRSMGEAPVDGFTLWIHRIARNVYLSWLKKRLRSVQIEKASPPAAAKADEPESLLARERSHLLRREIAKLPPKMRLCVLLRIHPSEPNDHEIAQRLGIAVGTVKSQLSQARDRLRGPLAALFGEIRLGPSEEP